MKAIVDRIVDGQWAVLLVGEEEKEYSVEITALAESLKEGSIVIVEIKNETVVSIKALDNETKSRETFMNEKMNKLKARKHSNFKKN